MKKTRRVRVMFDASFEASTDLDTLPFNVHDVMDDTILFCGSQIAKGLVARTGNATATIVPVPGGKMTVNLDFRKAIKKKVRNV